MGRGCHAPRRPSPTTLLLAEVQRLGTMLAGILLMLERIEAEFATSTRERRQTNEIVDRLARQHVELRRDLGKTELHLLPRHSRRRPLGQ